MPAYCVGALTQEWQFTRRRTTCSTSAFGHTREAEPPAGHGVGLGPAVEQDQPVADLGIAQEALVLAAAVEHLAVDLVRQDGDVRVPLEAGDEALDLLLRHGAAAGIVRAVEDDEAGLAA